MRPLEGYRVGLLESRKGPEVAAMVERLGGTTMCAPAVRDVTGTEDWEPLLLQITKGTFDLVVILTAASFEALCAEAEQRGLLAELLEALQDVTLACRGPKPMAALRRRGLVPLVVTDRPHTTVELLTALDSHRLSNRHALLLHYGERNDAFERALTSRVASLTGACLYEWAVPEDVTPLCHLIVAVVERAVDAVLFTSQVQCRHLLRVAAEMNMLDALIDSLSRHVVVGAVGPVCASALRAAGVIPDVMPDTSSSVALVRALADYYTIVIPAQEAS